MVELNLELRRSNNYCRRHSNGVRSSPLRKWLRMNERGWWRDIHPQNQRERLRKRKRGRVEREEKERCAAAPVITASVLEFISLPRIQTWPMFNSVRARHFFNTDRPRCFLTLIVLDIFFNTDRSRRFNTDRSRHFLTLIALDIF